MNRNLHNERNGDHVNLGFELFETESEHLREILAKRFVLWLEQLESDNAGLEGILILCDPTGNSLGTYCSANISWSPEVKIIERWDQQAVGRNAISDCMETLQGSASEATEALPFHVIAMPILGNSRQLLAVLAWIRKNAFMDYDHKILQSLALAFKSSLFAIDEHILNDQLNSTRSYYEKEFKKKDILFQVARKLHANINVDSVLSEIMYNMKEIYPESSIELYLSQDSQGTNLPVKPLVFSNTEDDILAQAFMEGKPVSSTIDGEHGAINRLAVPLCGKQGVYGVLLVETEEEKSAALDVKFILMLADSAGTAFENARLHESSNIIINELRLINEITRRLNQSLKLNEVFHFASNELIKIFNADFGCILQLDAELNQIVVQSSNILELSNDIFSTDYGFSGIVMKTKEPIIISDYLKNPSIPSKLMETTKARSLIASPIMAASNVVGVILVAHRLPHYFSYDNYKMLQVLSGHIGLAVSNATLHAEVRRMVITDNLTNLYVRGYLDEQINVLQKKDFCGSLIVADIDHFKAVNDTYGHQVGDQVLIQVCRIIKSCIRETDIAARWGGEELAIYLPQSTIEQTVHVAERIRASVERETEPTVTVSCGISQWSWEDDKISVETLFYRADMALYEAKHAGRNQVKIG